jgi:hypothetical protein
MRKRRQESCVHTTIASVDFDTIALETGYRYQVEMRERSKIMLWSPGELVVVTGSEEVTIRNSIRRQEIKARRW